MMGDEGTRHGNAAQRMIGGLMEVTCINELGLSIIPYVRNAERMSFITANTPLAMLSYAKH
jgi:hypothetical protein